MRLHSSQRLQEEGSVWHFPHRGEPQAGNCDPWGEISQRLWADVWRKGLTLSSLLSSSKMLVLLFSSGGIIMLSPPMAQCVSVSICTVCACPYVSMYLPSCGRYLHMQAVCVHVFCRSWPNIRTRRGITGKSSKVRSSLPQDLLLCWYL